MENKFPMVAKTFQGLEDVLRDELISLGAENVEMGRRMVSFEGDNEMMYRANLCCRTALRILKPIEKFTARDSDELYDVVREIDWGKYMTPSTTFSIDSTVNSEVFTHSKFVTYRVKDGIVDHFRDKTGERPSIRVAGADLMFNVHIDDDRVTISLDSSGEPLSKRGYRVEQTEAPINEALAAGIIMKTGWRGDSNFVDPMCGSGTFLIEAALIAANINPGIYRTRFAFEKWTDFDRDLFEDLYNDDSAEREFNFRIYGGDIDPEAVAVARRNVREAKVEDMIEVSCRPMSDWTDNPEAGILVMNPPYGARLKPEDMTALYKGIGSDLKNNFKGWNAWIIGLNGEDFDNIGLKPSLKIPMLNGSLECELREYVMFDGRYDDFRAAGGSVRFADDDDDEDHRPRKMRRLSDDEWKAETRKFGHGKDYGKDRRQDKKGKPDRTDRDRKHFGNFGGGGRASFHDDDDRFENAGRQERAPRYDSAPRPKKSFEKGGFDRDRKGDFDRDRKGGFDRDRRGGFDRDRKGGFDRDRKGGFDRDRKGGFDKDRMNRDGFDREKPYSHAAPRTIKPQGPRIPADRSQTIDGPGMRSRRPKRNPDQE